MKHSLSARLFALTMTIGLLYGGSQACAESAELRRLLESQAARTEAGLKLSDDQKAKVRPILLKGVDQRMAVFEELGVSPGNPPGMLTARKLRSKLDAVAADIEKQLRPTLSAEQMQAYEGITATGKESIKAAILGK